MKEISTVGITQSTNPRPIFTCENESKASNISDIITNQSERKRSIDLTSNNSTVTNSEALKVSLSEQLKSIKRQKSEEFYQFKSNRLLITILSKCFQNKNIKASIQVEQLS